MISYRTLLLFFCCLFCLSPSVVSAEYITVQVRDTEGQKLENFFYKEGALGHFLLGREQNIYGIYGRSDGDDTVQIEYERSDSIPYGYLTEEADGHELDGVFIEQVPEIKVEVFDAVTKESIMSLSGGQYQTIPVGEDSVSIYVPGPGMYTVRASTTVQVQVEGYFDTGLDAPTDPGNSTMPLLNTVNIPTIGIDEHGKYEVVAIVDLVERVNDEGRKTLQYKIDKRYIYATAAETLTHVDVGETDDRAFVALVTNPEHLLDGIHSTVSDESAHLTADTFVNQAENVRNATISAVAVELFNQLVEHGTNLGPTTSTVVGNGIGAVIIAPAINLFFISADHPDLSTAYIILETAGATGAVVIGAVVGTAAGPGGTVVGAAVGMMVGALVDVGFHTYMQKVYDKNLETPMQLAAFDDMQLVLHRDENNDIEQIDLKCKAHKVCAPAIMYEEVTMRDAAGEPYKTLLKVATDNTYTDQCFNCAEFDELIFNISDPALFTGYHRREYIDYSPAILHPVFETLLRVQATDPDSLRSLEEPFVEAKPSRIEIIEADAQPGYIPVPPEILSPKFDTQTIEDGSEITVTQGSSYIIGAGLMDDLQIQSFQILINSIVKYSTGPYTPDQAAYAMFDWDSSLYNLGANTFELRVVDTDGLLAAIKFTVNLEEDVSQNLTVVPHAQSNFDGGFSLNTGESKTVRFTITNEGTSPTIFHSGRFVVNVSDGLDIVSFSSSDNNMTFHQYESGDFAPDKDGQSVTLLNALLQTEATYAAGEGKSVDVTFRANKSAQHQIHYRATFAQDDGDSLWVNYPQTGSAFPPQNWPVKSISLNVEGSGPAHLSVLPAQLNYGAVLKNSMEEAVLYISNNGAETLNWQITDHPDWLTVQKMEGYVSGGNTSTLIVTADTNKTSVRETPYTGTIQVTSNGGSLSIPVEVLETEANVLPPLYQIEDSYIHSGYSSQNYGNTGYVEVGEQNGSAAVALFKFGLTTIPPNKKIESAKLYLYADETDLSSNNQVKLFTITDAYNSATSSVYDGEWEEATVTWDDRPGLVPEREVVEIHGDGRVAIDITLQTQLWYEDFEDNNGVAIFPEGGAEAIWTKFYSSEAADSSKRPYVEIIYSDVLPDFRLVVAPNPAKLGVPGEEIEYTVTAEAIGVFSENVSLSCFGNLPPNLDSDPTFGKTTLAMGESTTLTLKTSAATPEGNYQFAVQGSASGISNVRNLSLQVGRDLGPALIIHDITGIEEPSVQVRVNYTATDSAGNDLTTKNWQFSTDSTNGVDGTWFIIDPIAIQNNGPKPSGQKTYITWDTTLGTKSLQGVQSSNLFFRMTVDNGVPVMTEVYSKYFQGGVDFEGLYFDTVNNVLWSTEDGGDVDAKIHKHNPGDDFEFIDTYTYWGDSLDETESDDPYGITWLPDSNLLLVAERRGEGGTRKDEGILFFFDLRYPTESPPYFKDYDGSWFDPTDYRHNEFTGLTWAENTIWTTSVEPDEYIYKHQASDYEIIEQAFASPGISPSGITWDGTSIWTSDAAGRKIYRHNMDSSLSVAASYDMAYGPTGLAWDGTYIYSCTAGYIYKYSVARPDSEYVAIGPVAIDNNLPPTISSMQDITMVEDGPSLDALDLWDYVNDSDSAHANLLFSISGMTDPGCGATIRDNRYLEFAPAENWHGSADVSLQVQDGENPPVTQIFSVVVTPENDPPEVAALSAIIFNENDIYRVGVSTFAGDPDNELSELAFSLTGNLNISAHYDSGYQNLILSSTEGWTGTEIITITATDPEGLSAETTVSVTVYPIAAPHIVADIWNLQIPEGESLDVMVKLSAEPVGDIVVNTEFVSSCDGLQVESGNALTFTSSNWGQQQQIRLSASEDQNTINDFCQLRLQANGLPDVKLPLLVVDNDPILFLSRLGDIDFGSVAVGEMSSTQSFVIQNTGGGTLSGSIFVPMPFVVRSSEAVFSLKSGEYFVVDLAFQPTLAGDVVLETEITSNLGNVTKTLIGKGYEQVAPVVAEITDTTIPAHESYTGPLPVLQAAFPAPTWSLVNGPAGMVIDSLTGQVSWDNPVADNSPYTIEIQASNAAGIDTESWTLTVTPANTTVSGTISLTSSVAADTILIDVRARSVATGAILTSSFVRIYSNQSSVDYQLTLSDQDGDYEMTYYLVSGPITGLVQHVYFGENGPVTARADAKHFSSNENNSEVNTVLLASNTSFSGVVKLPTGVATSDLTFQVEIYEYPWESPYTRLAYDYVVISSGQSSVPFSVEIPGVTGQCIIKYWFATNWPHEGYAGEGFYSSQAMVVDGQSATPFNKGAIYEDLELSLISTNPTAGDLTGDGQVDIRDALLGLQVLTGQVPEGAITVAGNADVNGNQKIDLTEAVYSLRDIEEPSVDPGTPLGQGRYYEVYGAMAGDYNLTKNGHTKLGTSLDGSNFNVAGFDRFIIYVPASSKQIYFDAFGLDSGWVDSQPGTEYAHWTINMEPSNGSWATGGDSAIEGPPDGQTMELENTTKSAYYSFSTLGSATLSVHIADGPVNTDYEYAVYGANAGDFSLATPANTLIGTSLSGNVFNVGSYDRFVIHIPASSYLVSIDAIGLDSGWVDSAPGDEFAHYTSNLNPSSGTWADGDHWVEGSPDGNSLQNIPGGPDGYYGFSTMGAGTLTIHTVQ